MTAIAEATECLGILLDVLIATSVNPKHDGALLQRIAKNNIPIIAESQAIRPGETVVAVDNYQAGLDLGHWAGDFAIKHNMA